MDKYESLNWRKSKMKGMTVNKKVILSENPRSKIPHSLKLYGYTKL